MDITEIDNLADQDTVPEMDEEAEDLEETPVRLPWTLPPFVFSPIRPAVQEAKPDGANGGAPDAAVEGEEAAESAPVPREPLWTEEEEPPLAAELSVAVDTMAPEPVQENVLRFPSEVAPVLPTEEPPPPSEVGTADGIAPLQEAMDRIIASLATLEERLAALPSEPLKPKEAAVEILLPQGGEAVEIPIKLRLETEDSRQLALLRELHVQREQLQEELAAAHRQIERLGKNQFKSSNVMEAVRKSTDESIAELRAALEARDQELAELRNLADAVRKEYQGHLAQELLRIADGLERSQQEAERLRASLNVRVDALRPGGFWGRWKAGSAQQAVEFLRERQADMGSWQEGLGFVQQRLLALLADAGVEPMEALGQPFDPHRHVAVGKVSDPAQPDNVVVEEQLKGYAMGDRVLRFAEVVVNKVDSGENTETQV
jgi:hypothetical protein